MENPPGQGPGVKRYEVAAYRFAGGTVHPGGLSAFHSFSLAPGACLWHYVLQDVGVGVSRSLLLARGANAATIRYAVGQVDGRAWLEVRPMVALRDFHSLMRGDEGLRARTREDGSVEINGGAAPLVLKGHREDDGPAPTFVADPQWWRNFEYVKDRERGQGSNEDVFSPGVFVFECVPETEVRVDAWVPGPEGQESPFREGWLKESRSRYKLVRTEACSGDAAIVKAGRALMRESEMILPVEPLVRAADQFVVKRGAAGRALTSIIAGYPWFSDWGRDTFISMRGLLLCTGRFAEALEVLQAFAGMQRRGLIPNCFDDGSGTAQYNTVDASLWFVHAACEYLRVSGDRAGFATVRQACLNVVDGYRDGTDFGIRMDADGLIAAGGPDTQLTWMDAKRDGVVFTPRHGKPVEISALWYSGLLVLAGAIEGELPRRARELRQLAELTGRGFGAAFWNAGESCLFDVLTPAGGGRWASNAQVRPNQIFAVSQPFSPLTKEQRAAVVACVRERLLTPVGLRTLDRADPAYVGRYEGPLMQRDAAYHNGTVWPWLIGPYCEAVLRVGEFSEAAKREARAAVEHLISEFMERRETPGPLRQIAEVYDGEPVDGVRRAEGCMAQAWSVGELIRVLAMMA
jgi:predicted glycogen debranching enzyme